MTESYHPPPRPDTNRKERKANREKPDCRQKAESELKKMAFICQSFENRTRANQALKQTHSPQRLEFTVLWGGGGGTEAGSRGLIHLMPQHCLARLPFVPESAGQTQRTDRTLQDALCASRGQQDKAIICPATSLACSPQLSHGTVDCRAPGSPPQQNTDIHHPGLETFRNQRTNSVLGEAPVLTQGARHHKPLQRNSLCYFQIQPSTSLIKTNTGECMQSTISY